MNENPDFGAMTDEQRARWHEARRGQPSAGRVVKRRTRDLDTHVSVRLNPGQVERLRQLSVREGWTVSALVRRFVDEKLDELVPLETPTQGAEATIQFEGLDESTHTSNSARPLEPV